MSTASLSAKLHFMIHKQENRIELFQVYELLCDYSFLMNLINRMLNHTPRMKT